MSQTDPNKKRRLFSVGKYEKEMLNTFFLFACIPLVIAIGSLYWLYSFVADPALTHSPLAVKNLEPVIILVIVVLIYYFLIIGFLAYRKANKMVGSIPRIIVEIDQILSRTKKTRLFIRKGDYLQELIDRINALIDKLPKN